MHASISGFRCREHSLDRSCNEILNFTRKQVHPQFTQLSRVHNEHNLQQKSSRDVHVNQVNMMGYAPAQIGILPGVPG